MGRGRSADAVRHGRSRQPFHGDCPARRSGLPDGVAPEGIGGALEHDPEKWAPVFRKRSCSNKKIERDDDSKKSNHALGVKGNTRVSKKCWIARLGLLHQITLSIKCFGIKHCRTARLVSSRERGAMYMSGR